MMPDIFDEFTPDSVFSVIVFLGSNDACKLENNIQHVPLENYKNNLISMIKYLTEWGLEKRQIIMITPPIMDDEAWKSYSLETYNCEPSHFNHLITPYAVECRELAKKSGVSCLDLNSLMNEINDADELKGFLNDGLHLSSKGGRLLFENLYKILKDRIDIELKYNFPYWKDLDAYKNVRIVQ
jgi:isoamyl acetate esterase